jgi:hypothetical protein
MFDKLTDLVDAYLFRELIVFQHDSVLAFGLGSAYNWHVTHGITWSKIVSRSRIIEESSVFLSGRGSVPQADSFCRSLPVTMSSTTPADTEPISNPTEPSPAAVADEEPQNPLTQKFSENEWAAVKELRVRASPIALALFLELFLYSEFPPGYSRKGV